jgi:hypothetical protein
MYVDILFSTTFLNRRSLKKIEGDIEIILSLTNMRKWQYLGKGWILMVLSHALSYSGNAHSCLSVSRQSAQNTGQMGSSLLFQHLPRDRSNSHELRENTALGQ